LLKVCRREKKLIKGDRRRIKLARELLERREGEGRETKSNGHREQERGRSQRNFGSMHLFYFDKEW
jgi:hypothetical protein